MVLYKLPKLFILNDMMKNTLPNIFEYNDFRKFLSDYQTARVTFIESVSNKYSLENRVVAKIISGFSLPKEKMENEERVIWKPKQEYKAFTRAFFEFPHKMGKHLTWSKKMAKENLIQLYNGMAYKHCPPVFMVCKNVAKPCRSFLYIFRLPSDSQDCASQRPSALLAFVMVSGAWPVGKRG